MQMATILFALTSIMPSSAQNPGRVIGTWSEFGCDQDQIIIKPSGQVIMKLWAGKEYGWLTQYHYWTEENDTVLIRKKKYKNSEIIEKWNLPAQIDKELIIQRSKPDGEPRTVHFNTCE